MASERTEQPTPKRLKKAREEGQIARSRDLALAAASVAGTVAMARLGDRLVDGLARRLADDLSQLHTIAVGDITAGALQGLVVSGAGLIGWLVGPIAVATVAAAVVMHGFQGGWSFAPGALRLNWSRLNPANGARQFGFSRSGLDTIKTLVTVTAIAVLGWFAISAVLDDSASFVWMSPLDAGSRAWFHIEQLLWRVAWALGALALGDYALQRYRLMSSLKMTKQEVRQEAKEGEVSAEVKGRIRQIQRDIARGRMMKDVARATVVITNPTHFAVALRYERATMSAPVVLAKGQDHVALKIREQARQHAIPIIENKPLAQTLWKTAEVGETIPAPLFNAVAEVLAYLVRIKQVTL
jgi:flagellar biosynthetic protein FlhB